MNKKNWLIIGAVVLVALGVWFYFDSREDVGLQPGIKVGDYGGLCGSVSVCGTDFNCAGVIAGGACEITEDITGVCVSSGECELNNPSKGIRCKCKELKSFSR